MWRADRKVQLWISCKIGFWQKVKTYHCYHNDDVDARAANRSYDFSKDQEINSLDEDTSSDRANIFDRWTTSTILALKEWRRLFCLRNTHLSKHLVLTLFPVLLGVSPIFASDIRIDP